MSQTATGATPGEIVTRRRRALIYIESYALLIFSFGVILSLSLVSYKIADAGTEVENLIGPFGNNLAWYLLKVFGAPSFLIPAGFLYTGTLLMLQKNLVFLIKELISAGVILIAVSVLVHLASPEWHAFDMRAGGLVGEYAGEVMRALFSTTGSVIITLTALFCSMLVIFRKSAFFYTNIATTGGRFLLRMVTFPFVSLSILLRRIFKGDAEAAEISAP
ncbi:MAG: DNA translocase FtsK 4TM domain-containing protein, partial [Deltaproteobacteria bacterium]|nr:DNA translocase FtsK 4TM domain-containing protein [Deltaproteobacteria bacterium]